MLNLQKGEKVLYQGKPGAALLGYWFITKIIGSALLIGLMFGIPVSVWLHLGVFFFIPVLWIVITFILFEIIFFIYQIPLVKTHHYFITNQRVYAEAGLLSKRSRSISFDKVTDVTIYQNFIERIFGIYNLGIQTAGMSGRPEISFIGIKDPHKPEQIIQKLIKK